MTGGSDAGLATTSARVRWVIGKLPWVLVAGWSAQYFVGIAGVFVAEPDLLFGDARLYYQATAAWVARG